MNTDQNKATARRVLDDIINRGNVALIDELFSPDFVDHSVPTGTPPTREGLRDWVTQFRKAFPDLHYRSEELIAEGDKVVQRTTAQGTMKGDFAGMPASGKSATWEEIHITRFREGKVIGHWGVIDQLKMLQQLGFVEAPRQPAATTAKR